METPNFPKSNFCSTEPIQGGATQMINRFFHEEEGQTLVEYGLLISLIAIVVIVVLTTLGKRLQSTFNNASSAIAS